MKPASRHNRSHRSQALSWLAVAVWALVIFYFSAQPSLSTHWGVWDFVLRKGAHMTEYAILSLLVWRALLAHEVPARAAVVLAGLASVAYAATDEFHQTFVTGRHGTPVDVAIDFAGICLAMAAVALIQARRPRRQTSVV